MSLEVKNIVKKYGDKVVVDKLNFTLDNPGVYALLGTNGAGKTTSIRIMLDMLSKDEGEVLWKGKPLSTKTTSIGYLAEERGLYPKYTLMDQLLYFARLKGVSTADAKKRIRYWAERLEMEEYLYPVRKGKKKEKLKKADELSKGNQQKIQLMLALLAEPELIILDEPLSGLDPVNSELFKSIIREEIAKEKFLIMSSHQMATIEEFCQDITMLNRGKTVLQGNLNEIKKGYGRVNMVVKCEEDVHPVIDKIGLHIVEETPDGIQCKVKGEKQAEECLKAMLDASYHIVRYELREPSLHEIFIEKAGDIHEE